MKMEKKEVRGVVDYTLICSVLLTDPPAACSLITPPLPLC